MKKKLFSKILAVSLSAVFCMGIFAACNKDSEQAFNAKVVPATVKYKLDEEITDYSESVSISVAGNEYESTQIIIRPDRNIRSLDVEVTDLTNGGNVIPADQIDIYWEHYIFIDQNDIDNGERTGFTEGFYPDALVPIDLRIEAGENMVRAGENQGIWLTVKTSAETPAGVYSGEVILKGDNHTETVPMYVRVFDFSLSSENHFMTAFAIWDGMPDDMLFSAYQSTDPQIAENYYDFMLDYRVSPTHIPNMSKLSLAEQTETFLEYLKKENVGSLALPYTTTTDTVGFNTANMEHILRALADAAVTDNSILDKVYAYFTFIDEPTSASYARVKIINETFHNLLVKVANEKLSASGLAETKEKFLDIECVNTTAYTQDKVDAGLITDENNIGIDTWCPTFDYFNSESYRYQMNVRKEEGDGVWWYGCVNPRNPYPTFSVNDHLMPQRFVAWMQMEYGIEGQLFWATNAYQQYSYELLDYEYRDVWKDPVAFPSAPGDGYLTYPGYKYGLYSPIPTIRLDNFRAGQEDYEYLYHLKELYEENAPAQMNADFNTYVSNLYRQLYQGVIARNDSHIFENVRLELANLIELAEKGIFVDMSTNILNNNCIVTVYSETPLSEVTLNGKELSASSSQGWNTYRGNFIVSAQNEYANVSVAAGQDKLSVSRYTGGTNSFYSAFDNASDLEYVTVSKSDRFGIDDVVAELSDKSVNGKSMKVTYTVPESPVLGYLPTVTVENSAGLDFSTGEVFRMDVYNESERNIELTIMITDGNGRSETLYKAYLLAGQWNRIEVLASNADVRTLDLKNIREMRLVCESLTSAADNMVLYFDNICLTNRGGA